ncbi:craniofacial development protein 2-like [Penaeus vannamei]|uniref:craniofacial development protein 2-like n=1 Tax=Penaeus vannamei TaxID=6689 RepID=UPI00387F86E7
MDTTRLLSKETLMHKTKSSTIPDRSRPGLTTAASSIGNQDGVEKLATGETNVVRLAKEEFTVGTWNVRTLHQEGKVNQLTYELDRYQWHVLGIAEMRWLNSGETTTDGHKLWYSGDEKCHRKGVGFLVHREYAKAVMESEPISSRVIRVRLNANLRNVSIVQAHAPPADCNDEETEEFYDSPRITLDKIPKKDIRIIQGDWNAKIGCDVYQNWKGTIGKFGVGEVNERGARLLEFCKLNNLVVANTFGKHKTSRRVTWIAPDGTTRNQIDFILLDRRCKSCIKVNKTRSFPGADIGSDHNLLMMTMKLKIKKVRRQPNCRIKYNLQQLKDTKCQEEFEVKIGGRFGALLEMEE